MTFLDDLAIGLISSVLEARTGQTISEERRWRVPTVLMPLLREYGIESSSQLVAAMTAAGNDGFVGQMVDARRVEAGDDLVVVDEQGRALVAQAGAGAAVHAEAP